MDNLEHISSAYHKNPDTLLIRFGRELETLALNSACKRRKVAAMLVSQTTTPLSTRIITGFNGPQGCDPCEDCIREQHGILSGTVAACRGVHAEIAVLASAARQGIAVNGQLFFVTIKPCEVCYQTLVLAGIRRCYYLGEYPSHYEDYAHILSKFELPEDRR